MITLTLATKKVFQTVGCNGLPEGKAVVRVSSRVMEAYDGCVLGLEEEVPEGVSVVSGTPGARRKTRSHRHRGWGAGVAARGGSR